MYIFSALLGAVAFAYGGMGLHWGDPTIALIAVLLGGSAAFFVRRARHLQRAGHGATAINQALAALIAGRMEEAERLWETIPPDELRISYLRRALGVQKALAAMNRGDLPLAVTEATHAMEGPIRRQTRLVEESQIDTARSLRALAHASLGHHAEALADVERVEASELVPSMARASLARAVLLARGRDFDALHAHYKAEGAALIDALTPRERALSRALRRMGRPRTRSVYREAAVRDEEGDVAADGARAWVRKVAPEAAKFVAEPAKGDPASEPEPGTAFGEERRVPPLASAAGRKAIDRLVVEREHAASKTSKTQAALMVGGGLGTFAIVWEALSFAGSSSPGDVAHPPVHHGSPVLASVGAGAVMLAIGVIAMTILVRRANEHRRRFLRATRTLARKDDPTAFAELEALSKSGLMVRRIEADRALATMDVRRGDFARALTDAERALQRAAVNPSMRAATQDLFTPDMIATHAYALAALDRPDEALAELALLEREYPSFAFAARASFRVHLMNAIRAGNYREAARISESRAPEMPVELRDDLLAELACAAAVGGLPEDAAEALRGELHDMPEIEAWLEKVAPGLQARIARGAIDANGASGAANVRIAAMPEHVPEDAHELTRDESRAEEAKEAASVLDPRP